MPDSHVLGGGPSARSLVCCKTHAHSLLLHVRRLLAPVCLRRGRTSPPWTPILAAGFCLPSREDGHRGGPLASLCLLVGIRTARQGHLAHCRGPSVNPAGMFCDHSAASAGGHCIDATHLENRIGENRVLKIHHAGQVRSKEKDFILASFIF